MNLLPRSIFALTSFCLASPLFASAQDTAADQVITAATEAVEEQPAEEPASAEQEEITHFVGVPVDQRPPVDELSDEALQAELSRLQAEAQLRQARLDAQLAETRLEASRAQTEMESANAIFALDASRLNLDRREELAALQAQRDAELLELSIVEANSQRIQLEKAAQSAQHAMQMSSFQYEIQQLEAHNKASLVATNLPQYLENPLQEDGTLVISDRRIPLNGPILGETANFVSSRIHFYNNQDEEKPIFIVIENCPGGSVFAGYQILNAMESSTAPIHVIVKGMAASMAAVITTCAEHSYMLPNAVLMHHQISWEQGGNLSEQQQSVADAEQWWERLASPVAERMGISLDEFIELMYANSVDGDWSEFCDGAVELGWVQQKVLQVEETAQLVHPIYNEDQSQFSPLEANLLFQAAFQDQPAANLAEEIDEHGNRFVRLPRSNPADRFYLFDPEGYYRH